MTVIKTLTIIWLLLATNLIHASPSFNTFLPVCSYLIKQHQYVDHGDYSLCYNESTEQPEFTMYELTRIEYQSLGKSERKNDFREDGSVTTGSASLDDYYDSNYDRGHLVPSGSMTYSKEANSKSFYMSNMSPMTPSFNRGVWARLEAHVRNMYFRSHPNVDSVIIYSIPYINNNVGPIDVIGENEVAVPTGYFKVIYVPQLDEFKCWYIDQFNYNKNYISLDSDFGVSISEVERKTGLFFKFSKKSTFWEDVGIYTSINVNIEDFFELSNKLFLNLSKKDVEQNLFLFGEVYLLGHNCKSVIHDFDKDVWKGSYMETRLSSLLRENSVLKPGQFASWGTVWTKLFVAGYKSDTVFYSNL